MGEIKADFRHILTDPYIDLSFTVFNGSDSEVTIKEPRGTILYQGPPQPPFLNISLPKPTFSPGSERTIRAKDSAVYSLRHTLPGILAPKMENARLNQPLVWFELKDSKIPMVLAETNPNTSDVLLPLWVGFSCDKSMITARVRALETRQAR